MVGSNRETRGDEKGERRISYFLVTPKPSGGEGMEYVGWLGGEGLEDVPSLFSGGCDEGSEAGEGARAG